MYNGSNRGSLLSQKCDLCSDIIVEHKRLAVDVCGR